MPAAARAGARAAAARRRLVLPARARTAAALPVDSVARFHLGNGARLERLNWLADATENGHRASRYGLMVNYLYDLDDIEKNHEAFAQQRAVVAAERGEAAGARAGARRRAGGGERQGRRRAPSAAAGMAGVSTVATASSSLAFAMIAAGVPLAGKTPASCRPRNP